MSTAEEIVAAALKVHHKERAEVATQLLRSLDEMPEAEWEEVWAREGSRRLAEMREGRVKGIAGEEVFADADALLS